MEYLHTMIRISNVEESLNFYCNILGLIKVRQEEFKKDKFTLIFLAAHDDLNRVEINRAPLLELTYNWDPEKYTGGRNFGHIAFRVVNVYEICSKLMENSVIINVPPRDGHMAFIKSPDQISIELLQEGDALPAAEPWASMLNTGDW